MNKVPVVRHGRFTLVEINHLGNEQDLLSQIVEISVLASFSKRALSVKDGLNYLLIGSGYSLCNSSAITTFASLPLPAGHHNLGPITLSSALKTMSGPTWHVGSSV